MSRGRDRAMNAEDGRHAVALARDAVRTYVTHGRRFDPGSMRDIFYRRDGAMVRLETATGRGRLRGCASAPERPGALESEPLQLGQAIVEAAVTAASNASRDEVRPAELSNISVSLFTVQTVEKCSDPATEIRVGADGVAMAGRDTRAWMYPTVPEREDWPVFEYLDRTARKAGLPDGAWDMSDVTVYRLGGQVFEEEAPSGYVAEPLE